MRRSFLLNRFSFAILGLAVTGGLVLSAVMGCKEVSGYDESHIYIGELVSLTGSESSFGESAHRAALMAVSKVNEDGGLNAYFGGRPQKRKLKLLSLDTASDKDEAERAAMQLIQEHGVVALVGEVVSERTKKIAPIAQNKKVPLISPASTNPALTEIGDYIFRACYIDPFQGFVMAKFAYEHLKLRRIAIFKDYRSSYSAGLAEYFEDTFTDLSGEIVSEQTYSTTDTDFSQQLQQIKSAGPDGIFIPGYYSQVAEIAKQVRRTKVRSRTTGKPTLLLGGDGWDSPELYKRGGSAIVGGYFSNHFNAQSKEPNVLNFINEYRRRYTSLPDGTAAVTYDAFGILIRAMQKALAEETGLPTREALATRIRDAIAETRDYSGVTGKISLNDRRDAVKSATVNRVDGESSSYVTTISP